MTNATQAAVKDVLARAEGVLIGAGAGMGVDSGLPDFRGNEGFWKAYPPFAKLGLGFTSLANPRWFDEDPALAWGFYGHRLELYRKTVPHAGFTRLRDYAARLPHGAFVMTSNVDGQFQKAGFDGARVCEAHGSIHHAQCVGDCPDIWACNDSVYVDPDTMRAAEPWPRCPRCGGLARPNILMFGDGAWRSERTSEQEARLSAWLGQMRNSASSEARRAGSNNGRLVIIELGAGSAVPTVRRFCEAVARGFQAPLIRINPREPEGPPGTYAFTDGAAATLEVLLGEL